MMVQRQENARWEDDTMQRCNGRCHRTGQEADSPSEGSLMARGADRTDRNNRYTTISNIS